MTEKNCAISFHKKTLKIYSPAENRYITRGQCQGKEFFENTGKIG